MKPSTRKQPAHPAAIMKSPCDDRRMRTPLPPVAAVIGFIDAINRGLDHPHDPSGLWLP
jgi:hypothetical protein